MPVWIGTFQGLLTPIIGIAVFYVALQQWKTNVGKLKLDLFDKRHDVYLALMKALRGGIGDTSKLLEVLTDYQQHTASARFLFGDDIVSYLEDVRRRLIEMHTYRMLHDEGQIQNKKETERLQTIHDNTENLKWIARQLPEAYRLFNKYIRFHK